MRPATTLAIGLLLVAILIAGVIALLALVPVWLMGASSRRERAEAGSGSG